MIFLFYGELFHKPGKNCRFTLEVKMTKISGIPEELRSIQQQNKKKAQTTTDGLFKTTFDQALSNTTAAIIPGKSSSLPPLGEVSAVNYTSIESIETGLDGKTYSLLDKLDQYSQKLGNPEISLKEIEPLISKIKEDATELSLEISKSDDNSSELKQLASESALSANTEYIKFMRGDYV